MASPFFANKTRPVPAIRPPFRWTGLSFGAATALAGASGLNLAVSGAGPWTLSHANVASTGNTKGGWIWPVTPPLRANQVMIRMRLPPIANFAATGRALGLGLINASTLASATTGIIGYGGRNSSSTIYAPGQAVHNGGCTFGGDWGLTSNLLWVSIPLGRAASSGRSIERASYTHLHSTTGIDDQADLTGDYTDRPLASVTAATSFFVVLVLFCSANGTGTYIIPPLQSGNPLEYVFFPV